MVTIDDVPDEILEYLLEKYVDLRPDVLMSAALVSRRWRDPAQRVLFCHVAMRKSEKTAKWFESVARQRYRRRSLSMRMRFVGWQDVVKACAGIPSSLEVGLFPYKVLLSPALADVVHLSIEFPKGMITSPSSPSPPFRLSHLKILADVDSDQGVLTMLLTESRKTLTTLSIHRLGGSEHTASSIIKILSNTSFPLLRRLMIRNALWGTYYQLLPFLPHLNDLTLSDYDVFSTIAGACSPTLSTLNLQGQKREGEEPTHDDVVNFRDLCESLNSPGFQNLRNLRLPSWLRGRVWYPDRVDFDAVNEAELVAKWEEFQLICDEHSVRFMFGTSRYRSWREITW